MDEVETIDQGRVGRNEQGAPKMGFGILWLAIGISFASAAWFGFGFWQAQTAQASRINALGLEVAGLAQVEDQMRVLSQSVDRQRVLLQEFEQAVGVQVERLQALEQNTLGEHDVGRLSEAAMLVRLASVSVAIFQDTQAAVRLMKQADRVIDTAHSSRILALRSVVNADIVALEASSEAQPVELYLQLSALMVKLLDQDFKQLEREGPKALPSVIEPNQSTTEQIQAFLAAVWQRVSHLIDFRSGQPVAVATLTDQDRQRVRHGMLSRLSQAQTALLARDTAIFEAIILSVASDLERYFDLNNAEGRWLVETLDSLSRAALRPDLPTVDASTHAINATYEAMREAER